MGGHGAEDGLPLTPLAQWMRETTGIQGFEDELVEHVITYPTSSIIRVEPAPLRDAAASQGPTILREPARQPHYQTGEEILVPFEFDRSKLYLAAREAVETYINDGHTQEEILEHERRIWSLYDKLIGENDGQGSH